MTPMMISKNVRAAADWCAAACWALSCLLTPACGSDNPPASDAGSSAGKCISPGTGGVCMCAPGRSGTTTCGEDKNWTACVCVTLPDGAMCREGEQLRCSNVCPGESVGRRLQCVNGSYDCTCPAPGHDAGS